MRSTGRLKAENEYLNDCEVIQNGEPGLVLFMGALETIFTTVSA